MKDEAIEPDKDPPCPDCGGNCAPECGLHPAGCSFVGYSQGYWMVVPGCVRDHRIEKGCK